MTKTAPVIATVEGRIGRLTLNRPKALNALDLPMIRIMTKTLLDWRKDASIAGVVVDAAGEKAFCAGGDILALTGERKDEDATPAEFYAEEYRLNTLIKEYPKPYVAMIDGIVMGGGVGISVHGVRRICGDKTLFAMPETGIGFYPDVGGTYFLPRLEGQTGIWLALTGARLKAADAFALGIATDYAPSDQHGQLLARLIEDAAASEDIGPIIDSLTGLPGAGGVQAHKAQIDTAFAADTVEGILARLEEDDSDWALKQIKILKSKSPTALKVTLRQMCEGQNLNFRAAMRMELGLSVKFVAGHDFTEGVRALLVDRDNAPNWQPDSLSAVSDDMVAGYFVPLTIDERLNFQDEE
ncbi:MAG: enoyl-CoA hydratase [Robiginitomaculum sp.]|nr:MAG: enoyl-CoA hydratase [Robiginitomaculum sp.]